MQNTRWQATSILILNGHQELMVQYTLADTPVILLITYQIAHDPAWMREVFFRGREVFVAFNRQEQFERLCESMAFSIEPERMLPCV